MDPAPLHLQSLLAEARWLEALARRLVADRAQADDLVQDVWRAAVEKTPREVGDARGWLARVLTNRLRESARLRAARTAREASHARPEASPSTADVVARADAQRALVECVLALDEPWRSTVLWRYFDDLSSEEIARREGVPASTVRNRLAHALELLRARLARGRGRGWTRSLALLVPELRARAPELAEAGTGAATITAATIPGGAAMALGWKLAGSLAVVALGCGLWWTFDAPESAVPARAPASNGGELELAVPPTRPSPEMESSRRVAAATEPATTPALPASIASPAPEREVPPPGAILGEILRNGEPGGANAGTVELLPGTRQHFPATPEEHAGHERAAVSAQGTFRFDGLAAGDYTLQARLPRGVTLSDFVRIRDGAPGERVIFEIGGARLLGHVWDQEGQPREGALLSIGLRSTHGQGRTTLRVAVSDARGSYGIEELAGGIYDGVLTVVGGEGSIEYQRHFNTRLPVDGELVLDFGEPRASPTWTGTLRTRTGEPVRGGATLHLRDATGLLSLETASCEPDGGFRVRILPGTYAVEARPVNSGHGFDLGQVAIGRDGLVQDLILPGARLVGRARLASGEPVRGDGHLGVGVRPPEATWPSAMSSALVDAGGRFTIEGLAPGTYGVYPHPLVLAGGSGSVTFDVAPGDDEVALTITLRAP